MEKLLKLLNEYEETENLNMYNWEIEWEDIIWYNKFRWWYETINVSESVIISKWYEFIKRLVDNEKINLRQLDCKRSDVDIPARYYLWTYIRYSIEKEMLMTLAIQDNPIELLTRIIK